MPLFLNALNPSIDILGNEQVLKYNANQVNNAANLLILNAFNANAGIFPLTGLSFANKDFKGFRFYHESVSSSIYGNFSLQTYDKFGISTNIFKYNEQTDNISFFKNVSSLDNNITSAGIISATIGSLRGNNLSAHSASSISVGSSLLMNNNSITGLANPINNQDAATKQYVDNNPGVVKSIMHGFNNLSYSSNIGIGDHLMFDGVSFSRGTNISLDTSTPYSVATNTPSVGRITLSAGKTYKLVGSINNVLSANFNATRWVNSDNGTALGLISGSAPPVSTTNRVAGAGTIAYITTSVATRVELRITFNAFTSVNGTLDAIGTTWFTVEEV